MHQFGQQPSAIPPEGSGRRELCSLREAAPREAGRDARAEVRPRAPAGARVRRDHVLGPCRPPLVVPCK